MRDEPGSQHRRSDDPAGLPESRRTSPSQARPKLTLVSVADPATGCLAETTAATAHQQKRAPSGELAVRRERLANTVIIRLTGTLDRATSTLLQRELDAQLSLTTCVVADLTGLDFIDPSAVEILARADRDARDNGQQLCIEGARGVSRLLQFSNSARLSPGSMVGADAAKNENYYFALAMACADVDHERPLSDRPRGTPDRSPTRQQARAAPPLLPSAARAAPPPTPIHQSRPRSPSAPLIANRSKVCPDCATVGIDGVVDAHQIDSRHHPSDDDPPPIVRMPSRADTDLLPAA